MTRKSGFSKLLCTAVLLIAVELCRAAVQKDPPINLLWKSCFKHEDFSERKLCPDTNDCRCHRDKACCVNVTTSVPQLPGKTQKLSCRACFNGKLTKSVFKNIAALNLTHLDLGRSGINTITKDALTGFKNLTFLEELDFSSNVLRNLTDLCSDRIKFPHLKVLNLHKNMFYELENVSLNCFRNLTTLNIGKNRMKCLNFRHFENLTSLVSLDLHSNWFSNVSLPGNGIPTLERLNLSKNEFALFPPNLCPVENKKPFPKLTYLNLAENLITIPFNDKWACLTELKVLNLTRNPVRRLINNTFAKLTSLKELLISHVSSSIDEIQIAALNHNRLSKLDLSHNKLNFRINAFRSMFTYSASVVELDISGNFFNGLELNLSDILGPMVHLEKLHLMKSGLKDLPRDFLCELKNLKFLDMNSNEIGSLPNPPFCSELNLSDLNLSNNKLHTLDSSWLVGKNKVKLHTIDLSDNPFDCGCTKSNMDMRTLRERITISGNNAFFGTTKILNWPSGYKCDFPAERVGTEFRSFEPSSACKEVNEGIFALIVISCFLFVFFVVSAVVYRNIWYIRYWIYKLKRPPVRRRRGNDPTRQPLLDIPDEVVRDVFLINHENDDKFVLTDLKRILENQMGYSSCIYTRNCCNGSKLELMVDGIYSSMHTIAVVSKTFLKDPWCLFQLNVAFDRRVREKNNNLMLLLLDDIDFQSLNKYWCVMLTKTPTAYWCPARNDIRRDLFNEQIQKHLGVPVNKRYRRALSA